MTRLYPLLGVLFALAFAISCSDDGETNTQNDAAVLSADETAVAQDVINNYSAIVLASYEDSITEAQKLRTALQDFVADPTEDRLEAAKQAWLAAREPYLQTEVYRFYDGPIDNPTDGPEGLLNAWPMDENHVDYVQGMPTTGIINDPNIPLDADTLEGKNGENDSEANVSVGWHPIEFLLWGQDFNANGPGNRPHTDYVTDGSGTASNQQRRGEYLLTIADLLITHLEQVRDAWLADNSSNYRATFTTEPPLDAIKKVMTGMIVLAGFETAGERLQAALDSKDQEDEHSCFSDNTHRDMIQDVQGILNVFNGSYNGVSVSSVSGLGIKDLIERRNPDLATEIGSKIDAALQSANELPVPFDQAIAPGASSDDQDKVQALIDALREVEEVLFDAFELFGLTAVIPE